MISVGAQAPPFVLQDQFARNVSLSDFSGQQNLLILFYPRDWTPTCTGEVPALQEAADDFAQSANTMVCSLSCDSRFSHAAWGAFLGGISYPMLSDSCPFGAVSSAYGAYVADKCVTDRATVIIDKSGIVRYSDSVGVDGGPRVMDDLLKRAEAINGPMPAGRVLRLARQASPPKVEYRLFVSGSCGHCHQASQAVKNLHSGESVDVRDVQHDPLAMHELLLRTSGKPRVPTLVRLSDDHSWLGPRDILPVLIAHAVARGHVKAVQK
jgi:mycoredoxin-dependent peroxiredoxin